MTVGKVFLDTNVLLRATHPGLPLHQESESIITQFKQQGHQLWISRQVVREYLVQVTRPGFLSNPLSGAQVESQVQTLRKAFAIADETDAVTGQLIDLLKRFPSGGKQIHDVNIVATMLANQITTLVTTNIADMRRFESLITLIPVGQI